MIKHDEETLVCASWPKTGAITAICSRRCCAKDRAARDSAVGSQQLRDGLSTRKSTPLSLILK
jgi:hypothetical protein